jgi:single-stranded-DNA-specific exonuclease
MGDSPTGDPFAEPPWRATRVAYSDVRRLELVLGCPEPMAWILARRGLADPAAARAFLGADGDLGDPLAIAGVGEAAARLRQALDRGEHVAIHGDYDCDGVCSTAILAGALRARGGEVTTFLPSRFTDGYGVSVGTVERLADEGARVLTCVDCGTSSVEALQRAHELGMDVIVLDHHRAGGSRPPGIIANPALGRGIDALPAAAGVVFDVVRALAGHDDGHLLAPGPDEGVDLAGLATIADAVPLIDGNRRLVHRALASIRRGERPGIVALLAAAGQGHRGITPRGLSFTLAPAINAAGRLADASRALDLMLCDDPREARGMAEEIWALNGERRQVERRVTAEAMAVIDAEPPKRRDAPITVVAGEGWHEGVVGIVASRLVERYGRPAIVLSQSGDEAKGSGRSLPGLDLHQIVASSSALLTRWGGHAGAVGVSLASDDIPAFRDALEEAAHGRRADIARARTRAVDAVVAGPDLTLSTAEALEALAPFGRGNPEPRIVIPGCTVTGVSRVGEGRHLKARLGAGGVTVPAIGFSMGRAADDVAHAGDHARYDAVARLEVERWQDTVGPRVTLEDLAPLPAGPSVPGGCAIACDSACSLRVAPGSLAAMVTRPFGVPPPRTAVAPPVEVRDRRGEGRALALICALAGADSGVVALVSDVPRRRSVLHDVLAPGRLGVEVAVLGGDRCDVAAMRDRLARARGGPLLAMLDYRALAHVEIPPGVHLVAVDPPVTDDELGWLGVAAAGRTAHLAWGPDEAALALRVLEGDLAVRDVARSMWPALMAAGHMAWGADADAVLAGGGSVARAPRAIAVALAALAEAGLLQIDARGVAVMPHAPRADLDTGAIGRRAAAICDDARVMAGRAMSLDVLGTVPDWLPHDVGALS